MYPGYTISEEIYRGRSRVVYRGRREADGAPVILKTSTAQFPGRRALANLRREYEILRALDIEGVARAVALEASGEFPVLVLEDAGGMPLKTLAGGDISLLDFLRLARRLAGIIAEIHRRDIIHKDINPNNVLVDGPRDEVTVVDFSIASRLPFERQGLEHPSRLEGTIAYMSPEQTGRMNRDIDYRTDLYSLGATLYELLVGRLPFASTDPLEVIHGHIAMSPRPPHELDSQIPRPISDIVVRLLAKTPEERYQSALGLREDLDRCIAELESTGAIRDVVAGGCDVTDRFVIPQRLYGRDAEIARLLESFERTCAGGTELVTVCGYSGIGKTSLIHEIHKLLPRRRANFISGKFDQLVRNVPYAAVTQAFAGLVRQLLTESDESISRWRAVILESLGGSAQVIIDVIPEVEMLIGPQPPVPALGANEAQNRFNLLFQSFLGVFAKPEHPLVIFLDDLQWADSASLSLLRSFLTNPEIGGLLVLGAYRDNEVADGHPLLRTLAEIGRSGSRVSRIALRPLEPPDLNRFVADTLRCDAHRATPLTEIVRAKTEGNPFFVTQFLKSLHHEGVLTFTYPEARWNFDLPRIRAVQITDNVVDLMAAKIERLPRPTREALELAACIGGRFDLRTLAIVSAATAAQTAGRLREALEQGLVIPIGDAADLSTDLESSRENPGGSFRFLHDRVQQAAYALIPEDRRPLLHLTVARLMLEDADGPGLDERIFEVADQFNLGEGLIEDPEERLRVADVNFRAGLKAKASAAFATALSYFKMAWRISAADLWTPHYTFAYPLLLEIAECEYLCGRFEEAERDFEELVRRARTPLDEAHAHILRVVQYENMSRYRDAIAAAKDGLRLFDIDLPQSSEAKDAALAAEIAAIDAGLRGRRIADLIDLPVMSDPERKMAMRLLMAAWAPAYIAADHGLIALIPARMVTLSLRHGNTEESACGYVVHGITVGTRLGDYAAGYEFGRLALAVNEKFDDLNSRAKVHHLFSCFVNLWQRPLETCFAHARTAYESGLASGDLAYATYASFHETWYGLLAGRDLSSFQEEYGPVAKFLERIQMKSFADAQQVILHWGTAFEGKTEEPGSLSDDAFTERRYARQYEGNAFFETFYFTTKLHLLYSFARFEEAAELARKADGVVHSLAGTIWPVLCTFYHALTLLAEGSGGSPRFDIETLPQVQPLADRLALWAASCPENFRYMDLLVRAEMARRTGNAVDAVRLYEEAIRATAVLARPSEQALANELYAGFWKERGEERIAAFFMSAAKHAYAEWGAAGKVAQLTERYPELIHHPSVKPTPRGGVSLSTTQAEAEAFDLSTVMKAARAIAGEIEISRLLSKLMHILIENAGAQRGLLILEQGGESLIQARGMVGDDPVEVMQAAPVQESSDLALAVVNYVKRTLTSVVLEDARTDEQYAGDMYIMREGPKSILCTPVVNQGELVGMVYLENNLATAAFTPDRIQVIQMLSAHAAIAIRNAELFAEVTTLRDRLQAENIYLQEEIKTQHGFEEIVGKSKALSRVLRQVEQVAPTGATVLITGETGTGKELIARAIHNLSERRGRPLVTLNCGAIARGLVESELFGHEKGAFTGAVARKIGRFELADGGTLFLDEIGDLTLDLQVKLLRVLQEGEMERVGGSRTQRVDVRVIAATHRNLEDAVAAGEFRSDLYYRLSVFPIQTPPLRERREDIPLLVHHFVLSFNLKLGKKIESIPKRTMDALIAYGWPGNIRELRNVIERAVIISSGTTLELGDWIAAQQAAGAPGVPRFLEDVERLHILQALERTGWRVSGPKGAALILGLKPTTLEARMRKLGIARPNKLDRRESPIPNIS